jgi:4-amino-4-deoxy-L-arabinose transferase-like glycosyltransferase
MTAQDAKETAPGTEAPLLPWGEIVGFFQRKDWVLGLIVVAFGIALRVGGVSGYWINPDEGIYYSAATSSFGDMWVELTSNSHPPLYYFMLWGLGVFTTDFVVFRLISLVCGGLAIWAIYLLGREVGGILTGLVASFIVAISSGAIVMSQIMRPYMFQIAVIALLLYFLVRYQRTKVVKDLALYSLLMVVALLTHYSSFLVVGGIGTVLGGLLVSGRFDRVEIKRLVLAHVPVGLTLAALFIHLSYLVNSDLQIQAQTGWLKPHMIAGPADLWPHFIGAMRYLFGIEYWALPTILLLGGLGFSAVAYRNQLCAITVAVVAMAVLAAGLQQHPFGCTRHSMYLLPIFAVPMALPLAFGLRHSRGAAVITTILVLALLLFRGPVNGLLRVEFDYDIPIPEQVTLADDIAKIEPVLAELRMTRAPILTQLQTYYVLLPLFEQERRDRKWETGEFFHIPWGNGQIIINLAWKMSLAPFPADPKESFEGFLTRIDSQMPELGIKRVTDAVLVSAGWEMGLERDLQLLDNRLPPAARVTRLLHEGVPQPLVRRIDLPRFLDVSKD